MSKSNNNIGKPKFTISKLFNRTNKNVPKKRLKKRRRIKSSSTEQNHALEPVSSLNKTWGGFSSDSINEEGDELKTTISTSSSKNIEYRDQIDESKDDYEPGDEAECSVNEEEESQDEAEDDEESDEKEDNDEESDEDVGEEDEKTEEKEDSIDLSSSSEEIIDNNLAVGKNEDSDRDIDVENSDGNEEETGKKITKTHIPGTFFKNTKYLYITTLVGFTLGWLIYTKQFPRILSKVSQYLDLNFFSSFR